MPMRKRASAHVQARARERATLPSIEGRRVRSPQRILSTGHGGRAVGNLPAEHDARVEIPHELEEAADHNVQVMGRCAWGVLEREKLRCEVRLDEARRIDVQRVGAEQVVGSAKVGAFQDAENALVVRVHERVHGGEDLGVGAVVRVVDVGKCMSDGRCLVWHGGDRAVADAVYPLGEGNVLSLSPDAGEAESGELGPRRGGLDGVLDNDVAAGLRDDGRDLAEVPVAYEDFGPVLSWMLGFQRVQQAEDGLPGCLANARPLVPLDDRGAGELRRIVHRDGKDGVRSGPMRELQSRVSCAGNVDYHVARGLYCRCDVLRQGRLSSAGLAFAENECFLGVAPAAKDVAQRGVQARSKGRWRVVVVIWVRELPSGFEIAVLQPGGLEQADEVSPRALRRKASVQEVFHQRSFVLGEKLHRRCVLLEKHEECEAQLAGCVPELNEFVEDLVGLRVGGEQASGVQGLLVGGMFASMVSAAVTEVLLWEVQQHMPQVKDFLLSRELHLESADRGFTSLAWIYEMALTLRRRVNPRRVGRRGGLREELGKIAAQADGASGGNHVLLVVLVVLERGEAARRRAVEIPLQRGCASLECLGLLAFFEQNPVLAVHVDREANDVRPPVVRVVAEHAPGGFRGAKVAPGEPRPEFVVNLGVHRDVVTGLGRAFEEVFVEVLKKLHAAGELDVRVALPQSQNLAVVLDNEAIHADWAFAVGRRPPLTVRALSSARAPSMVRIAAEVEFGFGLERPRAAFDAVLERILGVARMIARMNHVLQHEVA
eukprot:9504041-Pyramimonas_sp.AAC.2